METKKDIQEEAKAAGQTFDGGITEEQIQAWKAKHGKVIRIDVIDDGDLHVGYFHRPRLETMSAVVKMTKTDEIKGSETLFDNCWLGGSTVIRHDAVLFMEAGKQLATMLSSCRSSIKNL